MASRRLKTCTGCRTPKELSEFTRRTASRDGLAPRCRPCQAVRRAAWYAAHRDEQLQRSKAWMAANRERFDAYRARWQQDNAARLRERYQAHYQANKSTYAARSSQRKQRMRKTVPWFDREAVDAVYALARALRERGFDVEVDHIVPLRSALVCGLHVQGNLRLVFGAENRRKGNRVWPDMPDS